MNEQKELEAVRAVLQRLQEVYANRDVSAVEAFMKEAYVPDESSLIIGTNQDEWMEGYEKIKALFTSDWENWGDINFDLNNAKIVVKGEVAWTAMTATCKTKYPTEQLYNDSFEEVKELLEEKNRNKKDKLLEVIRIATTDICEAARGEVYIWPFRFTAILVKRENKWLFQHMHFSFPTTMFPDIRLVSS